MNRPTSMRIFRLLAWVSVLVAGSAPAIEIQYVATELPETTPGEDLWRYDYFVSDMSFLQDQGFFVEFDFTTYSDLQDPPMVVNGDWSPIVIQPDNFFPDNGFYDALALVDDPSLANAFSLTFVWFGGATAPGSQPFTAYDETFQPIATGTTVPVAAIPLPSVAALLVLGLIGLKAARRRVKWTPLARSRTAGLCLLPVQPCSSTRDGGQRQRNQRPYSGTAKP